MSVHTISQKWLHFKHRLYKFSPLLAEPMTTNVDFVAPAYMRMLFVAKGGGCNFTVKGYETVVYSVADGKGMIIDNVPCDSVLNCPTNGAIYVDLGKSTSDWGLIAGSDIVGEYSIDIGSNADLMFTTVGDTTSTLDIKDQDLVETSTTDNTIFSIDDRDLTQ